MVIAYWIFYIAINSQIITQHKGNKLISINPS